MLFNSYEFIFFFLPVTFIGYFYLNNKRFTLAAKIWLVSCSLFFYSWWNVAYLPLILASMVINYSIGTTFGKPKRDKIILAIGIIFNISLLGYFKYSDFFIENINWFFGQTMPSLQLVLPLAISFFTFQQIAYLVDSYKGYTRDYDVLNYALFVREALIKSCINEIITPSQ